MNGTTVRGTRFMLAGAYTLSFGASEPHALTSKSTREQQVLLHFSPFEQH